MLRTTAFRLGLSLLVLLQSGCGTSPPTRFYALASVAPTAAPVTLPANLVLQVDLVALPAQLDRLQLVRRVDANQFDIAGFERWAGPLDEQIRRVLSTDLTERTAAGGVIGPQAAAPPARLCHVAVDIDDFAGDVNGRVTLRAHWALVEDEHADLRAVAELDIPSAGMSGDAVAAGMSTALGELADQIVSGASALHRQ